MPTEVLELAMWAVMWASRVAGFVVGEEEEWGGEVESDGDMARKRRCRRAGYGMDVGVEKMDTPRSGLRVLLVGQHTMDWNIL